MIERHDLRIHVGDVAPTGVATLGGRLVLDAGGDTGDGPVLCCFAGGGMSGRYFELGGSWDMAGHLAAAGVACLIIDHPGVGSSDRPDDGWALTPDVVGEVDAAATERALDGLRAGTLVAGLTPRPALVPIGLGHSMGAMFVAMQQARRRPYAGVVLLGHSGRGLPEVLTADERAVAGDAERIRAEIVALARARFTGPFPGGTTTGSEMLVGPGLSADARQAIDAAAGVLLATGGLVAMLPGSHDTELASVDVPVFVGMAEFDIGGAPHDAPRWLTGSRDVTLHVLPGAFHNSNVAERRTEQWDRIAEWARWLASSVTSGR